MNCIWCENEIPAGSTACPLCGRKVSQTLTFDDESAAPEKPRRVREVPTAKSEKPAPRAQRPMPQARKSTGNRGNLVGWLALLLALILLIVFLISNGKLSSRIDRLEEELSSQHDTPVTEENPSEDTTEASQSSVDLLSNKDIRVEFVCDPERSTTTSADTAGVAVSMPCKLDPSVLEDGVSFVGTVCYESETHCEVRYDITKDEENGLLLEVSYDVIFSYLLGERLSNSQPFTIRWRVPGEETWHPMETSNGLISPLDGSESTKASYAIACGNAQTETEKDQIEVQVEICRPNENGGSLTMILGTTVIDLRSGEVSFR